MTIQDMINQFDIQGAYCIKMYDYSIDTIVVLAEGHDFDCEYYDINDECLNMNITYMYAVDGVLNIEVE